MPHKSKLCSMTKWQDIRSELPEPVTLVAVSKYHSVEQIAEAYAAGCRDFGESRVQELKIKQATLPNDIRWHFIGHLQTNKVRDLLRLRPYLIQSVDSEHLLSAINAEAAKQGIVQDVLIELHVASEQTKSGFTISEFRELIAANRSTPSSNIRICGLMGMATNTDDEVEIRRCFRTLHEQFVWLRSEISSQQPAVSGQPSVFSCQLSMGMSDDYRLAIEEGSTMVRIGSAIFGERTA